jgi:hypothetical protein
MTIYNVTTVNEKRANTKSFLTEEEAREYFNTRVSNMSKCTNVYDAKKVSEDIFMFFVYSEGNCTNFMSLTTSEL